MRVHIIHQRRANYRMHKKFITKHKIKVPIRAQRGETGSVAHNKKLSCNLNRKKARGWGKGGRERSSLEREACNSYSAYSRSSLFSRFNPHGILSGSSLFSLSLYLSFPSSALSHSVSLSFSLSCARSLGPGRCAALELVKEPIGKTATDRNEPTSGRNAPRGVCKSCPTFRLSFPRVPVRARIPTRRVSMYGCVCVWVNSRRCSILSQLKHSNFYWNSELPREDPAK